MREIPFKYITSCNLRLILPNYRSSYDFVFNNWEFPSGVTDSLYLKKPNNTSIQTRILRQQIELFFSGNTHFHKCMNLEVSFLEQ